MFVHSDGNVIFEAALCCSSSRFFSSNRKTENALWSFPRGCSGMKRCDAYLLSWPIIASFSSCSVSIDGRSGDARHTERRCGFTRERHDASQSPLETFSWKGVG